MKLLGLGSWALALVCLLPHGSSPEGCPWGGDLWGQEFMGMRVH